MHFSFETSCWTFTAAAISCCFCVGLFASSLTEKPAAIHASDTKMHPLWLCAVPLCCQYLIYPKMFMLCRLYLNSWSCVLFTDLGRWFVLLCSWLESVSFRCLLWFFGHFGVAKLHSAFLLEEVQKSFMQCQQNFPDIHHCTFSLMMSSFICIEISLDLILKLALDGYSKTPVRNY